MKRWGRRILVLALIAAATSGWAYALLVAGKPGSSAEAVQPRPDGELLPSEVKHLWQYHVNTLPPPPDGEWLLRPVLRTVTHPKGHGYSGVVLKRGEGTEVRLPGVGLVGPDPPGQVAVAFQLLDLNHITGKEFVGGTPLSLHVTVRVGGSSTFGPTKLPGKQIAGYSQPRLQWLGSEMHLLNLWSQDDEREYTHSLVLVTRPRD